MSRIFPAIAPLVVFVLLGLIGCGDNSAASKLPRETWRVSLLQGKRIGYSVVTARDEVEDGKPVVKYESKTHLEVRRDGQSTKQDVQEASVETPDGRVLRFECEIPMGNSPVRMIGSVHGGRLDLDTFTPGVAKPARVSLAWPSDCGGPFAVEQSLMRKPMQPGEHRALKVWLSGFDRLGDVELTAKQIEPVRLLDGTRDLLHIEAITQLPGLQKMVSILWTDPSGEVVKSRMETMGGLETYRVSKAEALKQVDAAPLDLLPTMAVKVDKPLVQPRETKQVTYRVHLEDGDPAKAFVIGPTQAVKSLDPHRAEVTVYSIRPGKKDGNRTAPADLPTKEDREPNGFIQSDDPRIVADAKKAVGDERDPWREAVALERFVYNDVHKKDFSQAFASASEVAQTHEGDCTEHGVFLAALARARGLPARVAVGLVYLEGTQSFFYHLWTEVYIGDRWVPVDGTLARGGIGADHLKIAHTSLAGASAYSALLPVAQVVGRMKIEIVDQK